MTQEQRNAVYVAARTAMEEELEQRIGERAVVQHRIERLDKRIAEVTQSIQHLEDKEKLEVPKP